MNYPSMDGGRESADLEAVRLFMLRLKAKEDQLDAKEEEDEDVGMNDFSAIERKLIRQLVAQAQAMQ